MEFGGIQETYPNLFRIANGWPIRPSHIEYRGKPIEEVLGNLMSAGIEIDLGVSKDNAGPILGEIVAK